MMPAIDSQPTSLTGYAAATAEAALGTRRPQNLVIIGFGVMRMLEDHELAELGEGNYTLLLRAEPH